MPDAQTTVSRPVDFDNLFTFPAGEELPSDNATDDRMDTALQSRAESYRHADSLNWLLESTGAAQDARAPSAAPSDPNALRGLTGAIQQDEAELADDPNGVMSRIAGAVAKDIGFGAVEGPRQMVGGMRDAVQSMIDLEREVGPDVGSWLEGQLPLGGLQFYDKEGNFDLEYLGPEEWRRAQAEGM